MSDKALNLISEFKLKSVEEDGDLIIEGYANTTDKDRVGDVVLAEAWTKGGLDNYLKNPIILFAHNFERPIGKAMDHYIDSTGLKITAKISTVAKDIYQLIKEGILSTFSVRFKVKDADYDSLTDIFVIKDLDLLEISVVSVPANQNSTFSIKKSLNSNEYKEFVNEFNKTVSQDEVKTSDIDNLVNELKKEIKNMATKDDNVVTLSQEDIDRIKSEAIAQAEAKRLEEDNRKKEISELAITAGTTGAERLVKDFEEKLAEKDEETRKALEEMKAELKEKSEELADLYKNKMRFNERGSNSKEIVTQQEIRDAVMLSKILGKSIEDTRFGKNVIQKATDAAHYNTTEDWEMEFNTNIYEVMREKLVVEPLFTNTVPMSTNTMNLALSPETGYGTWVATSDYASTDGSSSGTARIHQLTDATLVAHKLATKEPISYEEEEDAILPLLQVIRNAVTRRMARSSDKALLRADSGTSAGTGEGLYPFNGLVTISVDQETSTAGSAEVQMAGTLAATTPVTVADMQQVRRLLGKNGRDPNELVYVVNNDVYYDLLEDSDFRTIDLVGDRATILRGQIGSINGSPVIVSGEFATKGADVPAAICVNMSNYLLGTRKGLTVERDRDTLNQKNWLIMTRRFDMLEIYATADNDVKVAHLTYPAS